MKEGTRGGFGYINHRKKKTCITSMIILLVAAAIFFIGLLLNKMSKANIFTIVAVLCVLPWAKQIVAFIVVFPYHSVSRERYEKVAALVQEPVKLYTDLVITSSEKVMNLDFAIVGHGQVIALVGKQGQDVAYIRKYLSEGVANWGDYKVKILENEKLFLKEAANMTEKATREEETEQVNSYLRSLIV